MRLRSQRQSRQLAHDGPPFDGSCPIERVPTLILAYIFGFVLIDHVDNWWSSCKAVCRGARLSNRWIGRIMVVCRRWHDIVIHTPRLWTYIAIDEEREISDISLYQERSRVLPCHVYVMNGTRNIFENVARYSSRIKELYCLFDERRDLSALDAFRSPAPILESLSIHVKYEGAETETLSPIFNGQMPNLRKLTLIPFAYTPGNEFRNLTHLRLENQMDSTWNMNDFMTLLEANPNLEQLHMFAASPAPVPEFSRFVHLPQLRVWYLCWHDWQQMLRILTCVGIPPTAQLIIRDVREEPGASISDSFPENISHLMNLETLTRLRVEHYNRNIDVLALAARGTATLRYDTGGYAEESLYLTNTWHDIGRILPLARITELWISVDCDSLRQWSQLNALLWKDVFSRMTSVRQICITGPCLGNAVAALNAQESLSCPQLRNLTWIDPSNDAHNIIPLVLHDRPGLSVRLLYDRTTPGQDFYQGNKQVTVETGVPRTKRPRMRPSKEAVSLHDGGYNLLL
ncbi:hypothetical protein WOLCODRAFT_163741 [Wolfiporia cocos MD-104 SS10]|uniref:Uncharacterized protein n=1 Tax=Wolfiporia cocos (strain MD-104) TaxID=742152 RepID=A0A2H3JJL5_WOLCO|nr:hypothetical protein WOLCODRAFT_163741 [Wolfiporia cocos MD-104 SS10]